MLQALPLKIWAEIVLTIYSQLADRNALQVRHVSKTRENDKACQDTGDRVDDGYSQGVPVWWRRCGYVTFLMPGHHYWHCWGREKLSGFLLENVVVEGVVAWHGHEGAKTNPDRVKNLSCSIHPNLQHIQNSWSLSVTACVAWIFMIGTGCTNHKYPCNTNTSIHLISALLFQTSSYFHSFIFLLSYLHWEQLIPLWHYEKGYPIYCSRKLHVINQQGNQNNIREQRSKVHHLHTETNNILKGCCFVPLCFCVSSSLFSRSPCLWISHP